MSPVTTRRTAPAEERVNFGDAAFYAGSFGIQNGKYALTFTTMMYQPKKQDGTVVGDPYLAVMMTAYPLGKPNAAPVEEALNMGWDAHESFQPTKDGKGLRPVPGGPGKMGRGHNWGLLRESLLNAGLPSGILSDDFSVIDGIWVNLTRVAEPEDRTKFRQQARTSEGGADAAKSRTVPYIDEILEGGKPWEGGGGIPAEGAVAPAAKARAAAAPSTRRAAAPAVVEEEEAEEEVEEVEESAGDVEAVAQSLVSDVLGDHADGLPRLKLRTSVIALGQKKKQPQDMVDAVIETYFADPKGKALGALLSTLGYTLNGQQVAPV